MGRVRAAIRATVAVVVLGAVVAYGTFLFTYPWLLLATVAVVVWLGTFAAYRIDEGLGAPVEPSEEE